MAHADGTDGPEAPDPETPAKRHETLAFLFLSVVLFPLLSVVLVGGFGFVIWMQHLIFGPPGGP
jgi:Periplasmic nitrate reductase system, NapE component